LTIPSLTITLSPLDPSVANLVRGSAISQAPITVHIGIYDVDSREILPPLIPRFVGVVDEPDVKTAAAGDKSTVVLVCESTSRALTIRRSDTRSGPSQLERDDTDAFYSYTGGMVEKTIYFGRKGPT
jgi:hypothetical protein